MTIYSSKFCCFFNLLLLSNCGVPSDTASSHPPLVLNRGATRTIISLKNNDALTLHYKFIKSGITIKENFSDITSNNTKSILESRNYNLANNEDVYIWIKTVKVVDPIVIELEHTSLGTPVKITVKDSSGQFLITKKLVFRNTKKTAPNIKFTSPMRRYKEFENLNGAVSDIAWVAVGYKLDPVTVHLTPSIPTFIAYMRGIMLN